MKTIITHLNPDLDAMTSVWLILRFLPGWENAEVKFVPAGLKSQRKSTTCDQRLNSEELWVDTGFGELDHHQTDKKTCAAVLVWEYIKTSDGYEVRNKIDKIKSQAVDRLVDVVLRIDHNAEDIVIPNSQDDFYTFLFNERQIIRGIRALYKGQSSKHLEIGLTILDAALEVLKAKIEAEKIIKNGIKFETKWGKAVATETSNEMFMHLAQEKGFKVVVSKDPKKGHIRIHALPQKGINFTEAYNKFKKMDPDATWYLHSSRALLLNGSSANPDMRPTKLKLEEIIQVLE
jgi:hypothetical protein